MNNKVVVSHSKVNSSLFTTTSLGRPGVASFRGNKNMIRMSHFTNIKTQIKNKEMLEKTLVEMSVPVTVSDKNDITVRGHNGEVTQAQFSIQQANGKDFGFVFNGKEFELVADVQFW
jgi:hypothetical protein